MSRQECLSQDVLIALLENRLSHDEQPAIVEHFRQCRHCLSQADKLISAMNDNSILRNSIISVSDSDYTDLNSLISQLKGISQPVSVALKNRNSIADVTTIAATHEPNDFSALETKAQGNESQISERNECNVGADEGEQIGPYRLGQKLGEGGFGIVYRAEQLKPIRRIVALKVIKPGMDSRAVTRRFDAERQTLAVLDHPNIARVLDAGTTDENRPYFVMELVCGVPITECCDQRELTLRERLTLFMSVCNAVHHAHQKGIIHRDLKPSNVLVAEREGRLDAKVIDFGIAKALSASDDGGITVSVAGDIVGTPLYMSPEQASLSDIDVRSDVYSLGVLAYRLLTGTTPIGPDKIKGLHALEVMRLVREVEPLRPSDRLRSSPADLDTDSIAIPVSVKEWWRQIAGDLDWILLKALEKERERRYQSARDLAEDIERYLNHLPVEATPPSAIYRLKKTMRRNWLPLSAIVAVFLSLASGATLAVWQAAQATAERDRADEKAKLATETAKLAQQEQQRANEKAQLAEQVVDKFYSEFAEKMNRQGSGSLPMQREFLLEAAAFYDQLSLELGNSQSVALKQVESQRKAAVLFAQAGEDERAIASFERGIQLSEDMLTSTELTLPSEIALIRCRSDFGSFLRQRNRTSHAQIVLNDANRQLSQLSCSIEFDDDLMLLLATVNTNLMFLSGHSAGKLSPFERHAFNTLTGLSGASPENEDYASQLAIVHALLGRRAFFPEDGAKQYFGTAVKLLEKLVSDHPNDVYYRFWLGRTYCWIGDCRDPLPPDRNFWFEKAHVELLKLATSHRDNIEYQAELTFSECRYASQMPSRDAGIERLNKLVEHLRSIFEQTSNADVMVDLAFVYSHLSTVYLKSNRLDEAGKMADLSQATWTQIVSQKTDYEWWCRERLNHAEYINSIILWKTGQKEEAVALRVQAIRTHHELLGSRYRRKLRTGMAEGEPLIAFNTLLYSNLTYEPDRQDSPYEDSELDFAAYARVSKEDPENVQYQRRWATAMGYYAYKLEKDGRLTEALQCHAEHLELVTKQYRRSISAAERRNTLACTGATTGYAECLVKCGRAADAAAVYHDALQTWKPRFGSLEPHFLVRSGATIVIAGTADQSPELCEEEKVAWREIGHAWLNEVLDNWLRIKPTDPRARNLARLLRGCQKDPSAAVFRDPTLLLKIPEPERSSWYRFWEKVEACRKSLAGEQ